MSATLLLVHAGATLFMVGLIWFVQIVHYPLFGGVGADRWTAYAHQHQRRTSFVVLPVMLVELATVLLLVIDPPPAGLAGLGAVLLAIVWGSTFGVQVPLHGKLSHAHDPVAMRRLVATNWIRTIAWSARGVVALLMLAPASA